MQGYISWQEDKLWSFLFTAYFRFTALSGDKNRFSPSLNRLFYNQTRGAVWSVLKVQNSASHTSVLSNQADLSEPETLSAAPLF